MNHWLMALAVVSAAACGGASSGNKGLVDELRAYNEGIRWQDYASSALRIPVAEREAFLDEHEVLADDLKISHYEVLRVRFRSQQTRARVDVKFTWFADSEGIVHRTVTRQEWVREGKVWLLADEVRLRGEPMPGVAEAPEILEGDDAADSEAATEPPDRESGE